MITYVLQNDESNPQKIVVRAKKFKLNAPAVLICIFLAVAIWLYVVSLLPPLEGEGPKDTTAETTTPVPDDTAPVADAAGANPTEVCAYEFP